MASQNNWKQLTNPRLFVIRKWIFELVKDKFPNHEEVIERISNSVATDRDLQALGKLLGDVYEAGFMKAISDYQGEFKRLGIQVNITPQVIS